MIVDTKTFEFHELMEKRKQTLIENKLWFDNQMNEFFSKDEHKNKFVVWGQWTDHWRDGEPCEFDVKGINVYPLGVTESSNTYKLPTKNNLVVGVRADSYLDDEDFNNGCHWHELIGDYEFISDYELGRNLNIEFESNLDKLHNLFGDHVICFSYLNDSGDVDVEIMEYNDHI